MTKIISSKILPVVVMLGVATTCHAITFEGTTAKVLEYKAEASTGLSSVYVLDGTGGVSASYESDNPQNVSWYRFSTLGGGYAEPIASSTDGRRASAHLEQGDMGYIVEDGNRRTYFWVIDYSKHRLELENLSPAAEQDCGRTALDFSGNAGEIPYYTVNGRRMVLSRGLQVEYSTLVFDPESFSYKQTSAEVTLASAGAVIRVDAPLCSTTFRLTGDRFMKEWGEEARIESPVFTTPAVAAETRASQTQEMPDNQQKFDGGELGGSAPCTITFEATVTDEAVFREWQISRDPEFGINENTFSDLQFDYVFEEQGKTYVRFIADNGNGTCEFAGPTYEVFIGESKLDIPNAFSPEASPGVNDLWKVSYRSLISYECHIFNRWGKELFSSNNPAEGWDGRSGGKYVPSGVYFYVIKARGADGVKYDRAGDINIIRYHGDSTPTPAE